MQLVPLSQLMLQLLRKQEDQLGVGNVEFAAPFSIPGSVLSTLDQLDSQKLS